MDFDARAFDEPRPVGGYLPLADHALIGDGNTAALVARDGAVVFCCLPRFDSPPLFCALLDTDKGGAFRITPRPADGGGPSSVASRQAYDGDSAVLVTDLRVRGGAIRIVDAMALHAGAHLTESTVAARGELVRCVEALDGPVTVDVDVSPRGDARTRPRGGGLELRCSVAPDLRVRLHANRALRGLRSDVRLETGQRLELVLSWHGNQAMHAAPSVAERINDTRRAWQAWAESPAYEGARAALVRRSAVTLKLLDNFANGAIVAAPTSSLPECIGGVRNWDYRYTWIRDAAFSVYALRKLGLAHEAGSFLGWVLDTVQGHDHPGVLYDIDGDVVPPEREDPELEGYRGSRPVRWGNAAREQFQHDSYGEILDCAYQWHRAGGAIDPTLWQRLCTLIDGAAATWDMPGHGIWEVRTPRRPFTYSAGLCQVALDRAVRIARTTDLPGDVAAWESSAAHIRRTILEQAWNEDAQSLTQSLDGGGGLDASVLALPLRHVVDAAHPRMVATTEAVRARLGATGALLHRYLPDESPDGLPGREGAFVACSFWLIETLARQGRRDEAHELFDDICSRVNHVGLLPEQIDPTSGAFLGNFPQALSHVGLVSAAVNLSSEPA